jgi:hypothetical protein
MQRQYASSSDEDAVGSLFETFISSIDGSDAIEFDSIIGSLSDSTRERLASFCLGRNHLQDLGRQIADAGYERATSNPAFLPVDDMKACSRAEWGFHHDF